MRGRGGEEEGREKEEEGKEEGREKGEEGTGAHATPDQGPSALEA